MSGFVQLQFVPSKAFWRMTTLWYLNTFEVHHTNFRSSDEMRSLICLAESQASMLVAHIASTKLDGMEACAHCKLNRSDSVDEGSFASF